MRQRYCNEKCMSFTLVTDHSARLHEFCFIMMISKIMLG